MRGESHKLSQADLCKRDPPEGPLQLSKHRRCKLSQKSGDIHPGAPKEEALDLLRNHFRGEKVGVGGDWKGVTLRKG